jgi:hypothetical protein
MSRAFVSPGVAFWAAVTFALLSASVNTRAQVNPPTPPAPTASPAPSQSDVPVREVVLFSSGVGYFQHQGTVQGDATAELRFKTSQINDILKSLVLQDLDGGRVGAVTYPSQDPLAKTLSSFQVDISDNPSLGDLLNKLRGARVSLAYVGVNGVENFPATVLGVEKRPVPGGAKDGPPLEKEWLNLVTDKGIRSLELEKMTKIQLEDPGLQEELNKALAALAGARDQDKKPVVIRFGGQGERRVRLGYVVETPIWKASYRLIFGDAAEATGKPQATLQGWAIVENQTDNDWNNVRLSLVSGRPISFIQDLYQPLYVPRPTVVPELYSSLRPQEYEGGQNTSASLSIASDDAPPPPASAPARPAMMKRSVQRSMMAEAAAAPPIPGLAAEPAFNPAESVTPISDASKVGELFQYTVGNVSLPRQRSAMIPIINDPIDAEKLSIFNQSVLDKHPLNGARLKNNSLDKKHLLAGPVTVFEEGRYAGDARLDNVAPGQERLLSYGIDLQVSVNVKDLAHEQGVQSGKIVKGVLELTRKLASAKEYSAENKAERDKKLVVEHPLRQGWNLVDTPKPVETTEKLYRFEQSLGAGKTEKLTVKEEYIQRQQLSLLPMDANGLLSLSRNGEMPQSVRDAAAKAAALKQATVETQGQIDERKGQIDEISADQKRIRENIKTVERTSEFGSEQTNKLKEQEAQLNKLNGEIKALRAKLNEQQRALNDYLNGLNVG